MKVRIATAAALVWVLVSSPLTAITPPPPPDGFTWQELTEIGGFLLVPEGWHFRLSQQEAKLAYFVTRDPITAEGFETGITVNVIRALPRSLGVSPSAFARDFVMQMRNAEQVERHWSEPGEAIAEFGVEWVDRDREVWVRNHHRLLANDGTGTLYQVSFRTPAEDWSETWPPARTCLDQILLDGTR